MGERSSVPLYRSPGELGRRLVAFAVAVFFRAYGAAAAVGIALSTSDSVAGKAQDGLAPWRVLVDRYEEARYAVEHREQIRAAVDYARDNAPDAQQLDAAVRQSAETIDRIRTTYTEVDRARETFGSIRPTNLFDTVPELGRHVQAAWEGRPSLESVERLSARAEEAETFLRQIDVDAALLRRVYTDLLSVLDNFASDEVGVTVGLMVAFVLVGLALGGVTGYWGRRGRPGFLARTLQRLGARHFRGWYVANAPDAMGAPLYAAARERVLRDLVEDPRAALDPDAYAELERHFAGRRGRSGEGRVGL